MGCTFDWLLACLSLFVDLGTTVVGSCSSRDAVVGGGMVNSTMLLGPNIASSLASNVAANPGLLTGI